MRVHFGNQQSRTSNILYVYAYIAHVVSDKKKIVKNWYSNLTNKRTFWPIFGCW